MLDLVDIFGSSSKPQPPTGDPWPTVQPHSNTSSNPWDSVGGCFITDRPSMTPECFLIRTTPPLHHTQKRNQTSKSDFTAVQSSTPVTGSSWMDPPHFSNASNPWAPCANSHTDPWEVAQAPSSPPSDAWDGPTNGGTLCFTYI